MPSSQLSLLTQFLKSHCELESYKSGRSLVIVDGNNLSVAAVAAVARYNANVELKDSSEINSVVAKSRAVIVAKVDSGASIYGISTGFGGSADTRTDQSLQLGKALLQHQHIGVLSSPTKPLTVLPLLDPIAATSMPESWVRGAMLIRMNSLIRGHSGVRWEIIEKIREVMNANITPFVPLRGSISASGDLSPLSYIAGTIAGNPAIRVYEGSADSTRKIRPSRDALASHSIEPISLASKEPLGILNGTAFSASVAALALNESVLLALTSQICTAMGTEALLGTRTSYHPFIHDTARPHPGQVEFAWNVWKLLEGSKLAQLGGGKEVKLEEDKYELRQDTYPLRTAPQFAGPQMEDIMAALESITRECNSTTDNPLVDGETGEVYHGGNFQAMAVTNAMEKTRLSLHHIGKLIFSQSTEVLNPTMNRGLPPSLAATDPSLNYHVKGVDIATAAYVAELGFLASPVSTHIQSAEMHNQAVNSMALVSARATITSIDVLSILTATYLYNLCQALDLRALRFEFDKQFKSLVFEELRDLFPFLDDLAYQTLQAQLLKTMFLRMEKTTNMDVIDHMSTVASSSVPVLNEFFVSSGIADTELGVGLLTSISKFQGNMASRATKLMNELRLAYLSGSRGQSPAWKYLGRTRAMYKYVRVELGVKMHGLDNATGFEDDGEENTIGHSITRIYEAIRDGRIHDIVVGIFEGIVRSE
ncbi:Protein pal1 [Marasmius sp. AFHP31]|nr:Protein pal1 [Marasmius sp. AFHP31]